VEINRVEAGVTQALGVIITCAEIVNLGSLIENNGGGILGQRVESRVKEQKWDGFEVG
jgi:hypothetical protein